MIIDKRTSLRMRGLGILLICLHNLLHLGCYVLECEFNFYGERIDKLFEGFSHGFWPSLEYIFSFWGWYGVPVFLFLSGYGLTYKHEIKGKRVEIWSFLCRNFKKLFLLLAPAFVLFVGVNYYLNDKLPSITDVVGQLTMTLNLYDARAIVPGVYWYFGVTLQLYIIYLLFHYRRSQYLLFGLTILSLLIGVYFAYAEHLSEFHFKFRHNSPLWLSVFTLGIWTARNHSTPVLRWLDTHLSVSLPALLIGMLVSSVCRPLWVLSPLFSVALLLLIARHWNCKPLAWVGSISAGVFVCHPIMREFALKGVELEYNRLLVCVLYVALSLLLGFAYMQLYKRAGKVTRKLLVPMREQWPMMLTVVLMLTFHHLMRAFMKDLPNYDSPAGLMFGFALACLLAYLTVCMVHLTKSVIVKVLVYAVNLVFFLICTFLWLNFETMISPGILMLLGETNGRETSEFFDFYLTSKSSMQTYMVVAAMLMMILVFERNRKKIAAFLRRSVPNAIYTFLLYLIFTLSGASTYIYYHLLKCSTSDQVSLWYFGMFVRPMDSFTDLFYSCYDIHLMSNNVESAVQVTKDLPDDHIACTESDSLNVVLVIGESYIKHHSHLYGYPLQTTPHLDAEREAGHLYVFTDAVSPYNMTSDVMKNVFSTNSIWNGESWYDYPAFPAIFKKAGYYVGMWDNQRNFDKTSETTFALNSYLFDKDFSACCYDETNQESFLYDQGLTESFKKSAHPHGNHHLVIFHLMGQHFTANKRFPQTSRYRYFKTDSLQRKEPYLDTQKKQMIVDYDNATRYNDETVWKIIEQYRDKNAVVVYFADHGEELYDYRNFKGRAHGALDTMSPTEAAMTLKYQFEVPFVVWLSDSYKVSHPEMAALLASAVNRPLMLDNVCQILFRLGFVKSPYYQADRDVLSDSYRPRKRLMRNEVYYEDFRPSGSK